MQGNENLHNYRYYFVENAAKKALAISLWQCMSYSTPNAFIRGHFFDKMTNLAIYYIKNVGMKKNLCVL